MVTVLILFGVIFLIVFATIKFKVHPVFSLILASVLIGVLFGFDNDKIIGTIAEGFGKTLSSIGLIIAFGTTIGVFLEKNGGTKVIAEKIVDKLKPRLSPLAMNIIGFIISIPVFCDSGFIILSSLNKSLSKKTGISLVVFAIALATGLYAAHVFVPPTPGPLAAAAVIEADLGLVLILGLLVAIPVALSGYFWAVFMGSRVESNSEDVINEQENELGTERELSENGFQFWQALLPLVLPIVLIALRSIAQYPTHPFGSSFVTEALIFLGEPIIALLLGACIIILLSTKIDLETKNNWIAKALKESGAIILVTGAGGAFGSILRASDIATIINPESTFVGSGILIAFLLAALLKTAQGSSTVAIITTAAIMAPLLVNFGLDTALEKALSVLAIGAGAMTVSHINDSYFWVVSQFSNLSVKAALKTHTLATLIQGITGISIILIINAIFA